MESEAGTKRRRTRRTRRTGTRLVIFSLKFPINYFYEQIQYIKIIEVIRTFFPFMDFFKRPKRENPP
jgi:hypothetical protein